MPHSRNNDITNLESQLKSMQTSIDAIAKENKDLVYQNQLLMQQLSENKINDQPSQPTLQSHQLIDPSLFRQLIQATNDQTAKLRTAQTNQEASASRKTPKNN